MNIPKLQKPFIKSFSLSGLLVVIVLCGLFVATIAYADMSYTVDFNDSVGASTDSFSITGATNGYYRDFAVASSAQSLTLSVVLNNKTNPTIYDSYDLLVYGSNVSASTTSASKNSTLEISSTNYVYNLCSILEGITYSAGNITLSLNNNATTSTTVSVVVIPRVKYFYNDGSDKTFVSPNRYVSSFFDLKMTNNEVAHNLTQDANIPAYRQPYYKNLYIISDIDVSDDFVLNHPCFINLLYSNIILNAKMTIAHHVYGLFEINSITGKINNNLFTFNINTPASYYSESGSTTSSSTNFKFTSSANFSKKDGNIDFSLSINSALLSSLLDDALAFAANAVPYQITRNLILPAKYHDYAVDYTYSVLDNPSTPTQTDLVYPSFYADMYRGQSTVTRYLKIVANFDTTSKTQIVPLNIIGKGNAAYATALANELVRYTEKSGIYLPKIDILTGNVVTDGSNNPVFVKKVKDSVELSALVSSFITDTQRKADFSIFTSAINLDFFYDGQRYRRIDFVWHDDISPAGYTAAFSATVGDQGINPVPLADIDFYLSPQTLLLIVDDEDVMVCAYDDDNNYNIGDNTGAVTSSGSISINGITLEEQRTYLERYVETVYLSSVEDVYDILRVDVSQNALYRGPSNVAIPYSFGFENITYNIYCSTIERIEELLDPTLTESEKNALFQLMNDDGLIFTLADAGTDLTYNRLFSFNKDNLGTIQFKEDEYLRLVSNTTLLMKMDFIYASNAVLPPGVSNYTSYRELIIPTDGIGGSEFTQYMTGDTFAEYFNSLPDGKLIDSIPSTFSGYDEITTGNAFLFRPNVVSTAVGLEMAIVNSDVVGEYCKIIQPAGAGYRPYWWQIHIIIDKIPPRNSLVEVQARFFIFILDQKTYISDQHYYFTVPGIYRYGAGLEFLNLPLYTAIMDAKDDNNETIYDSFTEASTGNRYLLADGAKKPSELLDASISKLTLAGYSSGAVSIKGVELLTHTKRMFFNGIPISDLEPFSHFTTYELIELQMNSCQLTDAMLKPRYLYTLNNLYTLTLNNNSLTRLTDVSGNDVYGDGFNTQYIAIFYRTVRYLYSDNNNITTVMGLSSVAPLIEHLHLRNNPIAQFAPLSGLKNLKSVIIANTLTTADPFTHNATVTPTGKIYYEDGLINIPEYVKLIDLGVTIIYYDRTSSTERIMTIGNNASDYIKTAQYDESLILNSIYIAETHYNFISFPAKVYGFNSTTPGTSSRYKINVDYIAYDSFLTFSPSWKQTGTRSSVTFPQVATPVATSDAHLSTDTEPNDDALIFTANAPVSDKRIRVIVDAGTLMKEFSLIYKVL
ncbi:MAG: hypothetical protein LBU04_04675 [Christensenellaceae bacterium]|jgi:hypothetical protein|nr:hypothetical protein [Christensenellaceae bacterium]